MSISLQDRMKRVPVAEQKPEVRAKNFDEVCLGYTEEEAMKEAVRCLECKNPRCVGGCPVSINIPGFIKYIKDGSFEEAAKEAGLETVPFDAGFFISIPCDDPDAISAELEKQGLFIVPLAKGLRVSVASISEEKCRKLPAIIKAAMK